MPAIVIVGLQWGDEGKGKITDFYGERADCVARFQGGNNAGHTVIVGDETYKFHLMPSGVIQEKPVVIGNGVVVDPSVLLSEIEMLNNAGIEPDLHISDRAHVIMPYHRLLDGAEEAQLGGKKIGTTGRGIGPCYADKISRFGVRMGDIVDRDTLQRRLERVLPVKQAVMDALAIEEKMDMDVLLGEYGGYGQRLARYVEDTTGLLNHMLMEQKTVLYEGAQGCMLDIDFGTYPYTTSSHPVAGGACTGSGVGPRRIDRVIGILKAYTTRVGEGPLPTELHDTVGDHLVEQGHEYGTTTGRRRRCGWLDLVAARYACRVNGVDEIALTKLDVLDGLDEVRLCTAYACNGETVTDFPASLDVLARCTPVYTDMAGWDGTAGVTRPGRLPSEAQAYIEKISSFLDVPVGMVSTGPARHETIMIS
ncbi:MAG: adenylosuccinate synthase [Thermoplasmatota archaeon]